MIYAIIICYLAISAVAALVLTIGHIKYYGDVVVRERIFAYSIYLLLWPVAVFYALKERVFKK